MAEMSGLISRLEAVTLKLESIAAGSGSGSGSAASGDVAPYVEAFDEFLAEHVAKFVQCAAQAGGEVAEHAQLVNKAFAAQRDFLSIASRSKKPSDADLQIVLQPLMNIVTQIVEFKNKSKNRDIANELATVSEAIPSIGWVQVTPKPSPYVKQMAEAGDFYADRVIKQYKDSNKNMVEWARLWKGIWAPLSEYVRKFHTTGVAWNANGVEAKTLAGSSTSTPTAAAPPAAAAATAPSSSSDPAAAAKAGLFSALQKGGEITSGLKKVDKSQMTHKNPELRSSSVVPSTDKPKAAATPKSSAPVKKGNPICELQGRKWAIEWQENNNSISIDDVSPSQTVYIYKCRNSVIKINQKVNTITLDSCFKTAVIFDSVVSVVDVVNSQGAQIQCTHTVPTINVDKCDGIHIFLSSESIGAEIISAKSSEMNVSVPGATPDDDLVEHPLPEQYKTVYNTTTKKFVTACVEHTG